MENNILKIKNENGKIDELEVVQNICVNNKDYVIVSPKGSELAYAYRTKKNNGFVEYESVGIGMEFKEVLNEYNKTNV